MEIIGVKTPELEKRIHDVTDKLPDNLTKNLTIEVVPDSSYLGFEKGGFRKPQMWASMKNDKIYVTKEAANVMAQNTFDGHLVHEMAHAYSNRPEADISWARENGFHPLSDYDFTNEYPEDKNGDEEAWAEAVRIYVMEPSTYWKDLAVNKGTERMYVTVRNLFNGIEYDEPRTDESIKPRTKIKTTESTTSETQIKLQPPQQLTDYDKTIVDNLYGRRADLQGLYNKEGNLNDANNAAKNDIPTINDWWKKYGEDELINSMGNYRADLNQLYDKSGNAVNANDPKVKGIPTIKDWFNNYGREEYANFLKKEKESQPLSMNESLPTFKDVRTNKETDYPQLNNTLSKYNAYDKS